jgi:type II secretory pathway predicted ATPase ExeA
MTARQREALGNLRYGLTTPRGLTLLLGEAGTGKTTVIHTILAESPSGVDCVLMSNPTLTRPEFYEFLAQGFGFDPEVGRSKTQVLLNLGRRLEERGRAGRLTALIVDEAQSLPYELLEEIRLLSNMETPTRKLLNVVLAGQPELADRLNDPELRQLKQRISLRCDLRPFEMFETAAYMAGRLRIAGGRPEEIFSREAIAVIHQAARGVPRIVNVVADNALIGGFASQVKPITKAVVQEVVNDFDLAESDAQARPMAAPRPAPVPSSEPAPEAASLAAAAEASDSEPAPERAGVFALPERRRRFSFF